MTTNREILGLKIPRRILRVVVPVALVIALGAAAMLCLHTAGPQINPLPMVRQATPYTCGVACLESILYYYGQEWREDNLAKELKTTQEQGTDYHEIVRFAESKGLKAVAAEGMTVDDLRRACQSGNPVMVAFQAWGDRPESYANDWDDGHYSIVVGVDSRSVFLMDPSTLGNYTFIPIPEFEMRWHDSYTDRENRTIRLVHFGIAFSAGVQPAYNPKSLMPLK
jgi:predicted double-glycine peptidase